MQQPKTARQLAFVGLCRVISDQSYSNLVFDSLLRHCGLDDTERRLAVFLFKGVLERWLSLEFLIGRLVKEPQKLQPQVKVLLAMGLFQLRFSNGMPAAIAVDQTVETAKQMGLGRAAGLINGVLRNDLRQGLPALEAMPFASKTEEISVLAGVDPSLVDLLLEQYGYETTKAYCLASLAPPAHYLRVNTVKTTDDALQKRLEASGVEVEQTFLPHCYFINNLSALLAAGVLEEGLCYLQDITCQMTALAVGAKPGETVMDLCAAPGSKSFTIAQEMQNKGKLCAFDLHPKRADLIAKGADKLGLLMIEAKARDGTQFAKKDARTAHRVLCDVPCSGLGTWAGKPEIKYKKASEIANLPEIQKKILCYAAEYVILQGTLIYSTCTVNMEENQKVAQHFLATHPDFAPCPLEGAFAGLVPKGAHDHLFLNEAFACDGFYLAAFRRIAP